MLSSSTNIILFILGCQSCDGDQSLLKTPVDLQTSGSKKTCISSKNYKSCNLQGEFFDYDDFQPRWKNMSDSNIFSLKNTSGKFYIDVSVCQTFSKIRCDAIFGDQVCHR